MKSKVFLITIFLLLPIIILGQKKAINRALKAGHVNGIYTTLKDEFIVPTTASFINTFSMEKNSKKFIKWEAQLNKMGYVIKDIKYQRARKLTSLPSGTIETIYADFITYISFYNEEEVRLIAQEARLKKQQERENEIKLQEQAFELCRQSAEQGNAEAQNSLGFMFQTGKGVLQDYKKAVEWYKKSAEQGNAEAQNNLGFMYSEGYGVLQDYKLAAEWIQKSAEQGNATGQLSLGNLYFFGHGVEIDHSKSAEWWKKSAEQGNETAKNNLIKTDQLKGAVLGIATVTLGAKLASNYLVDVFSGPPTLHDHYTTTALKAPKYNSDKGWQKCGSLSNCTESIDVSFDGYDIYNETIYYYDYYKRKYHYLGMAYSSFQEALDAAWTWITTRGRVLPKEE